jgi:gamma-glutamylcyclotransferase (GGCT)/AIG2-like uncharacterized protein YtfP
LFVNEAPSWDEGLNSDVAHLFVYGGLMRGFDLHRYLAGCTFVGEGWTEGVLVRAGRYPGLAHGAGHVQGELYSMNDPAAFLEALDELEDFDPLQPETSTYVRGVREVHVRDGSVARAWVYTYNRDASALEIVKGGDWRLARQAEAGP